MNLNLKIWRQKDQNDEGRMVDYHVTEVSPDMSFLEMMDVLNARLIKNGEDPVAFDHDCREGICGACSMVINGEPHGPEYATTTCQLHMRHFNDGDTVYVEPFRAGSFPVIRDLVVDRTPFDRIISAGGYVSVNTGGAPDGNTIPVKKEHADEAFNAATCIGCGACVAACPNSSAMLFVGAKVSQLALLPQGQPEAENRVQQMVQQMDMEGFGNCTNVGACAESCPKEISLYRIAQLNREYLKASMSAPKEEGG